MLNKAVPVMDRIRATRNSSFAPSKEISIEPVVTMNLLPFFRATFCSRYLDSIERIWNRPSLNVCIEDSYISTRDDLVAVKSGWDGYDIAYGRHSKMLLIERYPVMFLRKVVPFITHLISQGIESGTQPLLNLKGYFIGNPATEEAVDWTSQISYANNLGIISDKIYESTIISCEGEDYKNSTNSECAEMLQVVYKFFKEIND